jgi:flagellin-like hook-associated protein FlgL
MANLVRSAKELATQMANDTYDETARQGAIEQVDSIINQMVDLANTQHQGRYIFAGHQTSSPAFTLGGGGIVYNGDSGLMKIETEAGTKMAVNVTGSDLLTSALGTLGNGFDINPGINGDTILSDLFLGEVDWSSAGSFTVTDENLGIDVPVNLSSLNGNSTVSELIDKINQALIDAGDTHLRVAISETNNSLTFTSTGDETNPFLINPNTSLSDLNSGIGVDMTEGKFIVEYGENQLTVDLTGAKTIGDVIDKINSQCSGIYLTASIDPSNRRLLLTDNNGTPQGFKIREYGDQFTTASGLGILDDFDGNTLLGGELNPQPKYNFDTTSAVIGKFGLNGYMNTTKDTADLNPLLKPTTNIALLKNGLGLNLGKIKITLGEDSYTVDLSRATTLQDILDLINNSGANVTASINEDLTGISISPQDSTQSLFICDADDKNTSSALGIAGSPDIMGTLLALKDALNRNDAEDISNTIKILGDGYNKLLNARASVGAKDKTLDTTNSRLEDFKLNVTKLLSEVEDADIIKVATDLAAQEAVYKAALQATAQVIQPSLLDFLK